MHEHVRYYVATQHIFTLYAFDMYTYVLRCRACHKFLDDLSYKSMIDHWLEREHKSSFINAWRNTINYLTDRLDLELAQIMRESLNQQVTVRPFTIQEYKPWQRATTSSITGA